MKAVVYSKYGPPDVLELKEVPKPAPKDDEILIKIHAATVVTGDCEFRSFNFPLWFWLPLRLYVGISRPKRITILGQELSGEVEEIGKDVKDFKKGDQVFAATEVSCGAYAEYKALRAKFAISKKPENISFAEAATIPTGGLNALHYIRKSKIKVGEEVIIIGAAGSIGSFGVQLAKYYGAKVTGIDSGDKLSMLKNIGADEVIDYSKEDFTKSKKTYDIIFDAVGKSNFSKSVELLNPNGRYLLANPRPLQMLRGLWVNKFSDKKVIFSFADYKSQDLEFLGSLAESGVIKPFIDKSFTLEDVAEAHTYVESGMKKGNVVIEVV